MGAHLLSLLVAVALQSPQSDTTIFASPAVRELVERATARRRIADSAVADYQATVRYRLSLGFGRRQWALIPPAVVEEQAGRVQWRLPNDLRVDIDGRRSKSRSGVVELASIFDQPWFVPRGVGDSVRIFSNDFPATGALHPLSAAGPDWYHYARVGGVGMTLPDGRLLHLIELEVTPRRTGPALIAGRLLVDSATADVVRMTFRYVGTSLWVRVGDPEVRNPGEARHINAVANRVLSVNVDLEYALQEGRYWMPYRQAVFGTARLPIVSDAVIPFRATTLFEDYAINTGHPIAFTVPIDSGDGARRSRDSVRAAHRGGQATPDTARPREYADRWAGGRYELHRASDDSLRRYQGWPEPLALDNPKGQDEHFRDVEAELAELAEDLPGELTGRTDRGFAYERITDALQYNRVQGLSLGLGYRVRMPLMRFSSLYATTRYGLSDEHLSGRLTLRSDAPGARLSGSVYHDLQGVDPFAPGRTFENSLDALFAAHDNGDYLRATGGSIGVETSVGVGLDLSAGVRVERQRGLDRTAKSALNDALGGSGIFPPNALVDAGTFGTVFVRLDGFGRDRWTLTGDVIGEEGRATARVYGTARPSIGRRWGATLSLKAGVATEPGFAQTQFRLGGLQTVRGFEYGYRRAPAFWAAQLDMTPFRGLIRPVAFVDAGQAARPADLLASEALVGGGLGLSLLHGMIRFDFSVPMSPDIGGKVRFDFVVRGVR